MRPYALKKASYTFFLVVVFSILFIIIVNSLNSQSRTVGIKAATACSANQCIGAGGKCFDANAQKQIGGYYCCPAHQTSADYSWATWSSSKCTGTAPGGIGQEKCTNYLCTILDSTFDGEKSFYVVVKDASKNPDFDTVRQDVKNDGAFLNSSCTQAQSYANIKTYCKKAEEGKGCQYNNQILITFQVKTINNHRYLLNSSGCIEMDGVQTGLLCTAETGWIAKTNTTRCSVPSETTTCKYNGYTITKSSEPFQYDDTFCVINIFGDAQGMRCPNDEKTMTGGFAYIAKECSVPSETTTCTFNGSTITKSSGPYRYDDNFCVVNVRGIKQGFYCDNEDGKVLTGQAVKAESNHICMIDPPCIYYGASINQETSPYKYDASDTHFCIINAETSKKMGAYCPNDGKKMTGGNAINAKASHPCTAEKTVCDSKNFSAYSCDKGWPAGYKDPDLKVACCCDKSDTYTHPTFQLIGECK